MLKVILNHNTYFKGIRIRYSSILVLPDGYTFTIVFGKPISLPVGSEIHQQNGRIIHITDENSVLLIKKICPKVAKLTIVRKYLDGSSKSIEIDDSLNTKIVLLKKCIDNIVNRGSGISKYEVDFTQKIIKNILSIIERNDRYMQHFQNFRRKVKSFVK
jgi:hypothetical protein